jgi:hypothetical protein
MKPGIIDLHYNRYKVAWDHLPRSMKGYLFFMDLYGEVVPCKALTPISKSTSRCFEKN